MKKHILLLATVAAIMALMMVAMASAALAVPPESGQTGCFGGTNNAGHAIDGPTGSPSWGATSDNEHVSNPSKAVDAPGTQNNPGFDQATDTSGVSGDNCR
jgi:hypothetical protein